MEHYQQKYQTMIITALVLSMILLSILIPGGPIETRDFSHISPSILGLFNTFLTLLGMLSLLVAYFVYHSKKWAYLSAIIIGIAYFLVYVLDLAHIFPRSPSPMPSILIVIEITGTLLSFPLIFLAIRMTSLALENKQISLHFNAKVFMLIAVIIIISLAIILFATRAAMGE